MKKIYALQAVRQTAALLFQGRFDFFAEGKHWHLQNLPPARQWNLLRSGWDHLRHGRTACSRPTGIMIEPAAVCNLDCTGCWTNTAYRDEKPGFLALEDCRRVIDALGNHLCIIWLWGWGEPFLNKNIYEMIRTARRKGIIVISSTNGNIRFDDQELEELVRSGLSQLIVAVDGLDQETYVRYRINGQLDLVRENVVRIAETKRRLGLSTPLVNVRMVVMRHNEHQADSLREMAASLGADIASLKTMCNYRKGDVNTEFPLDRRFHRYAMKEGTGEVEDLQERAYCHRPWRRLNLFANGDLTPCEFDLERKFLLGNVRQDPHVADYWNNPAMQAFRRQFRKDIDGIPFCRNCPYKGQIVWDPTVECHPLTAAARQ